MGCRHNWGYEPPRTAPCDDCGGHHFRARWDEQRECVRVLRDRVKLLEEQVLAITKNNNTRGFSAY